MTTKLEESLDLLPPEKGEAEFQEVDTSSPEYSGINVIFAEADNVVSSLGMAEKLDHSLSTVSDLGENDKEMDAIAERALESYQNLCDMSVNMQDNYVGRVYEVAATMLKVALDAREAKMNRKLKTLELQLKKATLDNATNEGGSARAAENNQFDRNELLRIMREGSEPKKP